MTQVESQEPRNICRKIKLKNPNAEVCIWNPSISIVRQEKTEFLGSMRVRWARVYHQHSSRNSKGDLASKTRVTGRADYPALSSDLRVLLVAPMCPPIHTQHTLTYAHTTKKEARSLNERVPYYLRKTIYPGMTASAQMKLPIDANIKKYCSFVVQSGPLLHSPRTADELPED